MSKSISSLSVRRKADRLAMAEILSDLAVEAGSTAEILVGEAGSFPDERTVMVKVSAPGGLQVNIELSGDSALGGEHLLHWHMDSESSNLLAPGFAPSMNTAHYAKATDFASDFPSLLPLLKDRLTAAANGSAYMPPDDAAAHVAQRRRDYQDRLARQERPRG